MASFEHQLSCVKKSQTVFIIFKFKLFNKNKTLAVDSINEWFK